MGFTIRCNSGTAHTDDELIVRLCLNSDDAVTVTCVETGNTIEHDGMGGYYVDNSGVELLETTDVYAAIVRSQQV